LQLEWHLCLLAIVGGFTAGCVNTVAGSGSLITLPILVMLGLPSPIANGTNRVGVVVQSVIAAATLGRAGQIPWRRARSPLVFAFLGACLGAVLATFTEERGTDLAIGIVMVVMCLVTLVQPKRWLEDSLSTMEFRWWSHGPLFFVIGVYGGFVQAGVGVLLLFGLVMGLGMDPRRANGMKILITLVFTTAALGIFVAQDQVYWPFGALMAVGQGAGAWVAARFLVESEAAPVWIRRIVVLVTIVAAFKFLGSASGWLLY
jgi:uncharacterized protein